MAELLLPKRWTPLRYHAIQNKYVTEPFRFKIVPAGRRSGKTENAKRKLVRCALTAHKYSRHEPPYNFFAAAPTRDQAKRLYWSDLKALIPKKFILEISESLLIIRLITGSSIYVLGMDKPERIEGSPWDGGILDEYGNMKKETWEEHVLPALSDRMGWCDLIGVPEGRNHYYDLWLQANADDTGEWGAYHWISADILDPQEIARRKATMDEITYRQEYEADFVTYQGRAYYNFDSIKNVKSLNYYDDEDLIFCFDFNVSPGVAVAIQEEKDPVLIGKSITKVIGEVYIPRHSNTVRVCDKLIEDWSEHKGFVYCYGDATGASPHTTAVQGSDWSLIKQKLKPVFGDRLRFRVTKGNPPERDRVNAVNSRCLSMLGDRRLFVDPKYASHVIRDFESVCVLEGTNGELDKKTDKTLTHLTDSLGYYIEIKYPVKERTIHRQEI